MDIEPAPPAGDWTPDWAVHPGEHLEEYLEVRGWSQAEFARLADMTPKLVSTIIRGENPVTAETALKLERVLGLRASIWTGLQADWDLHLARQREQAAPPPKAWYDLVHRLPIDDMLAWSNDYIKPADIRQFILRCLAIGSPNAYPARKKALTKEWGGQIKSAGRHGIDQDHLFTWLMIGEMRARYAQVGLFEKHAYLGCLQEIRSLVGHRPGKVAPLLQEIFARAGVALVFGPPVGNAHAYGAARWLSPHQPVLQISTSFPTDDAFWMTLYHSAAHLALRPADPFVFVEGQTHEIVDAESWCLARNLLLGDTVQHELFVQIHRTRRDILLVSRRTTLPPGILVGLLQEEGVEFESDILGMKQEFEWPDRPNIHFGPMNLKPGPGKGG